jgi:hypothetical protein
MWRKRLILGSAVVVCLGLSVAASQAATAKKRHRVRVLPGNCNDTAPCHFRKERYRLVFDRDRAGGDVAARIARDVASGESTGVVRGMPTLFIDGVLYEGGYDAATLLEAAR